MGILEDILLMDKNTTAHKNARSSVDSTQGTAPITGAKTQETDNPFYSERSGKLNSFANKSVVAKNSGNVLDNSAKASIERVNSTVKQNTKDVYNYDIVDPMDIYHERTRARKALDPVSGKAIESENYLDMQIAKYDNLMKDKSFNGLERTINGNFAGNLARNAYNVGTGIVGGLFKAGTKYVAHAEQSKVTSIKNNVNPQAFEAYAKKQDGIDLTPQEENLLKGSYRRDKSITVEDAIKKAYEYTERNNAIVGDGSAENPGALNVANWANPYLVGGKNDFQVELAAKNADTDKEYLDENGNPTSEGLFSRRGLSKIGNAASTFIDNPSFALSTLADSAPYMVAPVGVAMSGLDALGMYDKGTREHDIENNFSKEATGDKLTRAAVSAAYGGLNYAEGSILRGALKAVPTRGAAAPTEELIEQAAKQGAKELSETAVEQAIKYPKLKAMAEVLKSVSANTGKAGLAIGSTAIKEGVVEGLQTQIEDSWYKLDGTVNEESVATGIGIGAAMAGGLQAPSAAIHGVKGMYEDYTGAKQNEEYDNMYGNDAIPTEALADPKNANYNPVHAINRIAFRDSEIDPDAPYDRAKNMEDFQGYADSISAIVKQTEEQRNVAQNYLDELNNKDESIATHQENIKNFISAKNNALNNSSIPDAKKANIEKVFDQKIEASNQAIKDLNSANIDDARTSAKNAQDNFEQSTKAMNEFMKGSYSQVKSQFDDMNKQNAESTTDDDVTTDTTTDTATDAPTATPGASVENESTSTETADAVKASKEANASTDPSKVSVSELATRFLGAPSNVEIHAEVANRLKDTSGMSELEIRKLRQIADIIGRTADKKDMGKVTNDVNKGSVDDETGHKFEGVDTYLSRISSNIASDNVGSVTSDISTLARFNTAMSNKADAANKAFELSKLDGQTHQIVRDENTLKWKVLSGDKKLKDKSSIKKNRGLNISAPTSDTKLGSTKLVEAINQDAKSVKAAHEMANDMVAEKGMNIVSGKAKAVSKAEIQDMISEELTRADVDETTETVADTTTDTAPMATSEPVSETTSGSSTDSTPAEPEPVENTEAPVEDSAPVIESDSFYQFKNKGDRTLQITSDKATGVKQAQILHKRTGKVESTVDLSESMPNSESMTHDQIADNLLGSNKIQDPQYRANKNKEIASANRAFNTIKSKVEGLKNKGTILNEDISEVKKFREAELKLAKLGVKADYTLDINPSMQDSLLSVDGSAAMANEISKALEESAVYVRTADDVISEYYTKEVPMEATIDTSDIVYDDSVSDDTIETAGDIEVSSEDLANANANELGLVDLASKDVKDVSPEGALSILNTDGKNYKDSIKIYTNKIQNLETRISSLENGSKERQQLESELALATNIIKEGFVQRYIDGVNSPLIIEPNLVPDTINNADKSVKGDARADEVAKDFINRIIPDLNINREMLNSVRDLLRLDKEFNNVVNNIFIENPLSRLTDAYAQSRQADALKSVMQYFSTNTDPKGAITLEANLVTAMAVAAHKYLTTAESTLNSTKFTVAATLGIPVSNDIKPTTYAALDNLGTFNHELYKELGASVMAALQLKGLKTVDADTPAKVQQALGLTVAKLLEANGYLTATVMTGKQLREIRESETGVKDKDLSNDNNRLIYLKPSISTEVDYEGFVDHSPQSLFIKRVADNDTKSGGLVGQMFKSTVIQEVSLEPIKTTPSKFDRFLGMVSKFQKGVMEKVQGRPYKMKQDNIAVLNALREDDSLTRLYEALGYTNPDQGIAYLADSKASKNEEITRSLNSLYKTATKTDADGNPIGSGNVEFYLPLTIWSQLRMGIGSIFNPQGNTLHRAMAYLSKEEATVKYSELVRENYQYDPENLTGLDHFLYALGFTLEDMPSSALGDASIASVDKSMNKDYLPLLYETIRSTSWQKASTAYANIAKGNGTAEDKEIVLDFMTNTLTSDVGAAGLSVLSAVASYHTAVNSEGKLDMTHTIFGQSDGSNNGPAITNTLMGVTASNIRKASGLFTEDDKAKSLSDYRDQKGADLYVQFSNEFKDTWGAAKFAFDALTQEVAKAADNLYDISTRSAAKAVLVPFNYGGGLDALFRSNGKALVTSALKKLDKIARNIESTDTVSSIKEWNGIVENVNKLIEHTNRLNSENAKYVPVATLGLIRENSTLDNTAKLMRGTRLNDRQVEAIINADVDLKSEATDKALTEILGDFMETRNHMTSQAGMGFKMFKLLYDARVEEATEKAQKIAKDKGTVFKGLTPRQLDKIATDLRGSVPSLNTLQGAESKIPMVSIDNKWAVLDTSNNSSNPVTIKFAVLSRTKNAEIKYKATSSNISRFELTDPNAKPLAMYIQSFDAYVTAKVQDKFDSQNYHDCNTGNANELPEIAKYQNQVFFQGTIKQHMGISFANSILKPLRSYVHGLNADGKLSPEERLAIVQAMDYIAPRDEKGKKLTPTLADVSAMMYTLLNNLHANIQNDINKLDMLSEIAYVNQYATEQGVYVPTAADRAKIQAEKAKVTKVGNAILRETESLFSILAGRKLGGAVVPLTEGRTATEEALLNARNNNLTKGTESLIDAKQLKGLILTTPEIMKEFTSSLKGVSEADAREVAKNILNALSNSNGIRVNIAHVSDVETIANMGGSTDMSGSHAWYDVAKREINLVVGRGSKITAVELIHELHHAITADAINTGRRAPKDSALGKAYKELNALYEEVKTKVNPSKANNDTNYMLGSIEEFVSTATTHSDAMNTLKDMLVSTTISAVSRVSTGLRKMYEALSNLVKAHTGTATATNPKQLNALEALARATANLVDAYNKEPNTKLYNENLGSIGSNGNNSGGAMLGAPQAKAQSEVARMSVAEVFKGLTGRQDSDANHNAMLSTMMAKAHEKVFSYIDSGDGSYTVDDIWNDALQSGEAPHATDALSAGFNLDAKEQFAVEVLEVTLAEHFKGNSASLEYKAMLEVFKDARSKLEAKDMFQGNWQQATAQEKATAQAKLDYLFDTTNKEYLSRFGALVVASSELNDKLKFGITRSKSKDAVDGGKIFNKIISLIDKAFNRLQDKFVGINKGSFASTRASDITAKLMSVSRKNRNKLTSQITDKYTKLDNDLNARVHKAAYGISNYVENIRVKPTSRITNILKGTIVQTTSGKPFQLFDVISDGMNVNKPNQTLGFFGELVSEVSKQSQHLVSAAKLMRSQKANENTAQRERAAVMSEVNGSFENGGANLKRADRKAINDGLLRTDAQLLLGRYSMKDLHKLLASNAELRKEIAKYAGNLNHVQDMRVRDLALYMVDGSDAQLLAKNAYSIAADHGLKSASTTKPNKALVDDIDHLASLYALLYTNSAVKKSILNVMESELKANGNKNYGGIESTLKLHRALTIDSKNELFKESPGNYIKGYIPDVTNHHKQVIVTSDPQEIRALRAAMYKEVGKVGKADADPNSAESIMFYTEDSDQQSVISGALPLYNYGAKGEEVSMDSKQLRKVTADYETALNARPANYDPRNSNNKSYMTPKYNSQGKVVGYRYESKLATKDTYLERDGDFALNLGTLNAQGFNKMANKAQSALVVQALHEDYLRTSVRNHNKMVYVGYDATDPVALEAWNRLPAETKAHAKEIWGGHGMWVANDAFNTIFGYSKISLTNVFDKDKGERNFAEDMFVEFMSTMLGKNARIVTARAHTLWQDAVRLTKNIIVLRNFKTMFSNLLGNTSLLNTHGVSLEDIAKNGIVAVKGVMQYRKDMAQLAQLELKQKSGLGDKSEVDSEIARLQHSIKDNPVYEFIQMGMNPGIVEDIAADDDRFSYQSKFKRRFEDQYNKVPKLLRKTAETLVVAPSTPLYQFLHSSTQFSDFAAKYTLYKHLTENANVSSEKALQVASDNFIDYDIPTSRGMQYMNDMGLVMFTKYTLRIQRALVSLMSKRPASVIGHALIMHTLMPNIPSALEPLAINHIGSPFRSGAFGLFGVLDEPLPIKVLF